MQSFDKRITKILFSLHVNDDGIEASHFFSSMSLFAPHSPPSLLLFLLLLPLIWYYAKRNNRRRCARIAHIVLFKLRTTFKSTDADKKNARKSIVIKFVFDWNHNLSLEMRFDQQKQPWQIDSHETSLFVLRTFLEYLLWRLQNIDPIDRSMTGTFLNRSICSLHFFRLNRMIFFPGHWQIRTENSLFFVFVFLLICWN